MPMPGSPPINITDPATRPPPRTRSNSEIPVLRRTISSTTTESRLVTVSEEFRPEYRSPFPLPARWRISSSRVFHLPQSEHCPAHFGNCAPHSVHEKTVERLATITHHPGGYLGHKLIADGPCCCGNLFNRKALSPEYYRVSCTHLRQSPEVN